MNYFWFLQQSENGGNQAGLIEDSSDGDGRCLAIAGVEDGWLRLTPGKVFIPEGVTNATLIFDYYNTSLANDISVIGASVDGVQEVLLETAPHGNGWQTAKVNLSNFAGSRYSFVFIQANFAEEGMVMIDNVKILDLLEYNLAAEVKTPKAITAGNKGTVEVTVRNMGQNDATGYKVIVTADGQPLTLNQTIMKPVPSMKSVVYTAEYAPSVFTEAGAKTVKATVDYSRDLNDDDNVAEAIVNVTAPTVATPENLTAQSTDGGVQISWTSPAGGTEEKTEDFEDQSVFEPFSIGGVTADNPNGKLGDWTLYDGDGQDVYGFNGITVPNLGLPHAAIVLNAEMMGIEDPEEYSYSGVQFLGSDCPAGVSDDWIISPELPGVAQTVSFFVSEASDQYGAETYEIYYSTTDTKVESFIKLSSGSVPSRDWSKVEFDLPAGAKYFAIHHTSNDVFIMYMDDFTFTGSMGTIVAFNIYIDQQLVGSVDANVTSFLYNQALAGNHEVAVTAVYANGAESAPVVVTLGNNAKFGEVTAIERIIAKGEPFDIYTINGVLVRQNATNVEGIKAGVYVVNNQKVIIK